MVCQEEKDLFFREQQHFKPAPMEPSAADKQPLVTDPSLPATTKPANTTTATPANTTTTTTPSLNATAPALIKPNTTANSTTTIPVAVAGDKQCSSYVKDKVHLVLCIQNVTNAHGIVQVTQHHHQLAGRQAGSRLTWLRCDGWCVSAVGLPVQRG